VNSTIKYISFGDSKKVHAVKKTTAKCHVTECGVGTPRKYAIVHPNGPPCKKCKKILQKGELDGNS